MNELFVFKPTLTLSFRKREVVVPHVRPHELRSLSAGDPEAQAGLPHLQGRGQKGRAQEGHLLAGAQGGGARGEVSGGGINLMVSQINCYE